MIINDYLGKETNHKKILIVSDSSRNKAISRKYEKDNNTPIHNVDFLNLSAAITSVYRYIRSEDCFFDDVEIIKDEVALVIFRKVVLDCINDNQLGYFTNKLIMNIATCKEIFNKVNLVRVLGWKDDGADTNGRTRDLEILINAYEGRLISENKMDTISCLNYVLDNQDSWVDDVTLIFGGEVSYLYEDMCTYSGIYREFLELLNNCTDQEDFVVHYYEQEELDVDVILDSRDRMNFYKGYGPFNEIRYIANDIFAHNYSFGSVTVLYTNPSLIPAIKACLGGNGIDMRVVTSYPYGHNEYISLARLIIDWAKDNFSEKALKKILENRVITIEKQKVTGDNSVVAKNTLYGAYYFNHVTDAANRRDESFVLGWGYERNREFIRNEKSLLDIRVKEAKKISDEADKAKALQRIANIRAILDLQEALLDIFTLDDDSLVDSTEVIPFDIFNGLLEFIKKHVIKTESYKAGWGILRKISQYIAYDDTAVTYKEALDYIEDYLLNAEGADTMSGTAVEVKSLNSFSIIERENVYVVGLSFKDMISNMAESSVLSDSEMVTLLNDGYKPTIEAQEKARYQNIYRTLASTSGKTTTFGYSSFDTSSFIQNNPSNLFRSLVLKKNRLLNEIPEFIYGNPKNEINANTPDDTEEYEIPESFYGYLKKGNTKYTTSNSSMENLLKCPMMYAFDKVLGVPNNEVFEPNDGQWLDQRLVGSYFHEVIDRYTKDVFIDDENYDEPDVDYIKEIAYELKEEFLRKAPAPFDEMVDDEINNIIAMAQRTIQRIIDSYNNDGWKVLLSEQRFDNYILRYEDYNEGEYVFLLNGEIDRIDYKLDEDNHTVIIRVADYKTGRKKSKKEALNKGVLFQSVVYKNAIMGEDCDEEMPIQEVIFDSLDLDFDEWELEFNNFQYEFPAETNDDEPLVCSEEDIDNSKAITRLRCILNAVYELNRYPDAVEMETIIEGESEDGPSYKTDYADIDENLKKFTWKYKKTCTYCGYKQMCNAWKEGKTDDDN